MLRANTALVEIRQPSALDASDQFFLFCASFFQRVPYAFLCTSVATRIPIVVSPLSAASYVQVPFWLCDPFGT